MFHSSNDLYGSSKVLINVINILKKANYEVNVVVPSNGFLNDFFKSKKINFLVKDIGVIRKKFLTPLGLINRFLVIIYSIFYLMIYIKRNKINLLYVNTSVIIAPLISAKICGIPTILHIHETFNFKNIIEIFYGKLIIKMSNNVVVVSKTVQNSWNKVTSKKLKIIYNGFLFKSFKKNLKKDKIVLTKITRISPRKGVLYFLKIAKKISNYRDDIYFKIVGDGLDFYNGYKNEVKETIKRYGLTKKVKLVGFKRNIDEVFSNTNFLVHTPIEEESLPSVLIEAIQRKIPVITTRMNSTIEILDNGKYGLLIDIINTKNNINFILDFINHNLNNFEKVELAYLYSKKKFHIKIFEHKILELIKSIIEKEI